MNIALIGYGRMGHAIETIALERGHHVVLKINSANRDRLTDGSLKEADVAIEFTRPEAAYAHVAACLEAGVPVVCGTTGWNEQLAAAKELCDRLGGTLLQASNFSVGVNLFFAVNQHLAALMRRQPEYDVRIREVHHTQKKDAPSGTAITTAEQIIREIGRKTAWALDGTAPEDLSITAVREDDVPGTHTVTYSSAVDQIELIHTAHNRTGFASGAVLAAEFLQGRKGIFTMNDVLGI